MQDIKHIFFDFGDVIGHFDIEHFNKFIEQNGGDSSVVESHFKEHKAQFDIDEMSEEEFWTTLGKLTRVQLQWEVIALNNRKNLMIDYRMIELIKQISIPKVILSNMDKTTVQQIREELPLDTLFKKSYFSCELKHNKMTSEILTSVCKENGVKPEEVLFIDDFEGNINIAKEFGFQAIQFTNYSQLKESLSALGFFSNNE